jgi:N-acyl-D-amino-acid deacylase
MNRIPRVVQILFAAALFAAAPPAARGDAFVIRGARVADGTGKPLVAADVRVEGDTIVAVGKLEPRPGERVVDGKGLVVAPGFIDVHNHSTDELLTQPLADTQVSQGISTVVEGPDGDSAWPVGEYLDKLRAAPAALNVATMVGHATVREKVMGSDFKRAATAEEIEKMAALVAQAMREGAAGLSSGLEYEVGSYSTTAELVALSRAAAKAGGFYMTHIRDEADKSFEAFAEAIAIGREAGIPVEISHIKLGTVGVWGRAREAVALFEKARAEGIDVTADCYPYEAWHSNMEVLVPNKKYDDPASVEKALADVAGAANITITACKAHPEYKGRTLAEIAASRNVTPVAQYIEMVKEGGADIIGHSMTEKDVRVFYTQPWVMVASDGGIDAEHPRGAGTFPRVLGRYARDQKWFPLEEAVRKMTSLPAARLKLADRGTIRAGAKADLVLFDPDSILDRSTFEHPKELAQGVRAVFVNGAAVWQDGKTTGARPGRVLAGSGAADAGTARGAAAAAAGPPPKGHLLIVGGGPISDALEQRFVELAGGPGRARIVVLPMASSSKDAGVEMAADFRKLGAQAERLVVKREAADLDETVARFDGATGIWFGGGDQSLLTAAIGGTRVERKIHALYEEGAVIGGTSAGAAVMSTPMITGDERRIGGKRPPSDKKSPLSEFMTIDRDDVVTRDGFALLPGAIVDQHFVRRRRHNRLMSVVLEHPDLVGIGLDESTALEVSPGAPWRIVGESVAVVYDARKARITPSGGTLGAADVRLQILPAGATYDLATGSAELPPRGQVSFFRISQPAPEQAEATDGLDSPPGLPSDRSGGETPCLVRSDSSAAF